MTLPGVLTYGNMLDICCAVTTETQASEVVDALVARSLDEHPGRTREEATEIVRANIGYLAGYCGVDVQRRFERLFGAMHPVFGAVDSPQSPRTASETFHRGVRLARGEE